MPKNDTLDALEEHEEHDDDYLKSEERLKKV